MRAFSEEQIFFLLIRVGIVRIFFIRIIGFCGFPLFLPLRLLQGIDLPITVLFEFIQIMQQFGIFGVAGQAILVALPDQGKDAGKILQFPIGHRPDLVP